MKTNRSIGFIHAAIVLASWPSIGHAEQTKAPHVVVAPSNAITTITVTTAEPSTTVQSGAATADTAPAQWLDIKDCTCEMRDSFFAGLSRLEAMLNDQINELTARRAARPDATDTADLDLAIGEMDRARFFLKLAGDVLSRATPQTWDKQKSKVGLAWGKSQEAYTKIKTHTAI